VYFLFFLKWTEVKPEFKLNKKPDLVLIVTEFFQRNYILSLALFFAIILIYEHIF